MRWPCQWENRRRSATQFVGIQQVRGAQQYGLDAPVHKDRQLVDQGQAGGGSMTHPRTTSTPPTSSIPRRSSQALRRASGLRSKITKVRVWASTWSA